MNIGIRLHDTVGTTLSEHLANAQAQGFSCVHLALQKVIPGFTMARAPELMTDALAAEVRADMAAHGQQLAVLGCYLNLATPDAEELERTYAAYKAHMRFAAPSDCLVIGTETGAPNAGYKTCPECWTEEALALFIERLRPVVKWGEEYGSVIAIEPVCRHIVSTPERAERVLDAIGSDHLQIILDTVNLLNPANHTQADALVEESIRRFGDRIRVLHMKDYQVVDGASDVKSMACGLGLMRYDRLLAFAKAHPGLPMTLEDTVPANAEAARRHLEAVAAAL